jgi:hypothetical protein
MPLFVQLNEAATDQGLAFLVIGGHAVVEHGFQRGTEDVDILVCKDDRPRWLRLVEDLGYRVFHDGGSFIQFEAPDPSAWDLDVMFVAAETLARLRAEAQPARVEGVCVSVPSLEHLLSLKVHALKHGHGLRVLKDLTDVAELLAANRVDPSAPWVRALFERYGDLETYERVVQLLT